jgi:hypothetical protein
MTLGDKLRALAREADEADATRDAVADSLSMGSVEASERIAELEAAIRGLLMSRDAAWSDAAWTGGHDWSDAVDAACAALAASEKSSGRWNHEEVRKVERDTRRLASRVRVLEEALRKHCNGTVNIDCYKCADPEWDHECVDRVEPCRACAALAAKEGPQPHPDDCACFYCCEEGP